MKNHYPYSEPGLLNREINNYEFVWGAVLNAPAGPGGGASDNVLRMLAFAHIFSESKKSQVAYLQQAVECGTAHFRQLLNLGSPIVFTIGERQFIRNSKTTSPCRFTYWLEILSAAIIMDNRAAVDEICKIDYEFMKAHCNVYTDAFDEAALNFIKGVFNPKADLQSLVKLLMEKSDPKYIEEFRRPYVYDVVMPFCNLLLLSATNSSEQKYQEVMTKAIISHQGFYTKSEDSSTDSKGWLALPLIAVGVLAKKSKNYCLAESNNTYVPNWLVYTQFKPPVSFINDDKQLTIEVAKSDDLKVTLEMEISDYLIENKAQLISSLMPFLRQYDFSVEDPFQFNLSEDDSSIISVKSKVLSIKDFVTWLPEFKRQWHGNAYQKNGSNQLKTTISYVMHI